MRGSGGGGTEKRDNTAVEVKIQRIDYIIQRQAGEEQETDCPSLKIERG